MTNQKSITAEIVTFTLADSITDAQFIAASKTTEAFLRSSDAFISRTLSKAKDGRWTDYILWSDEKAARAFADTLFKQPFAAAWMATIKPDTVKMTYETVLWQMSA